MITKKEYKCGICGETEQVETNHYGEIYSSCSICGNRVRSCVETIAKTRAKETALLSTYRYDLSNPEDKLRYRELIAHMCMLNYAKHEEVSFSASKHSLKWRLIESNLSGKTMPIYLPEQFEGQYVSNGVRLFDWCEAIFENKNIKVGYYLTEKEGF